MGIMKQFKVVLACFVLVVWGLAATNLVARNASGKNKPVHLDHASKWRIVKGKKVPMPNPQIAKGATASNTSNGNLSEPLSNDQWVVRNSSSVAQGGTVQGANGWLITASNDNGTTATLAITVPSGATTATGYKGIYRKSGVNYSLVFDVVDIPTISGISPTTGHAPNTVVITGTNLTGATAVSFNGTNAPTYTVDSATQITVTVPSGATTGPISVTTPGGTATSASFGVTMASGLYRLYFPPSLGDVPQGVATGTGLTAGTIQVGGVACTSVANATTVQGVTTDAVYNLTSATASGSTVTDIPSTATSNNGALLALQVISTQGATPSLACVAEHSPDDGSGNATTWSTLATFATMTGKGADVQEVAAGTTIYPHVRLRVSAISGQFGFTAGIARR